MVGDYILDDVLSEMGRMIEKAPRREIIEQSLENNGLIVVCPTLTSAIETANSIAPEHLEIQVDEPMDLLGQIRNAGAIFVGPWSPVPVGDYIAGPSHTLPTSGTARFSNPLTPDDFMKKSSIISYSYPSLDAESRAIIDLAHKEGFDGHAVAIEERLSFMNGDDVEQ